MRKWIAAMLLVAVTGITAGGQQTGVRTRANMPVPPKPDEPVPAAAMRVYDLGDAAGHLNVGPLVSLISTSIRVPVTLVSDSIFAVMATPEEHAMVEHLVASLQEQRAAELYRVEVVAYDVSADRTPALGAPAQVEKPMVRVQHNLARARKTQFEATVRQTYIAEWQPVVSGNAVGYQPVVKTVSSGLDAVVVVAGSGEQLDLDVTGRISKADVKMVEQPLVSGANLTMGLPVTQERSVQARTRIRPGVLTVISVTESLGDAGSLVVAAKVDRAP
ncbi:MAG: hypothetical protein FJ255_03555 [Phycisphaerae bacterium]|nr:hypothetical protein [Phycisphaerae bacterium]